MFFVLTGGEGGGIVGRGGGGSVGGLGEVGLGLKESVVAAGVLEDGMDADRLVVIVVRAGGGFSHGRSTATDAAAAHHAICNFFRRWIRPRDNIRQRILNTHHGPLVS